MNSLEQKTITSLEVAEMEIRILKKIYALEKRIADFEVLVQDQQKPDTSTIDTVLEARKILKNLGK